MSDDDLPQKPTEPGLVPGREGDGPIPAMSDDPIANPGLPEHQWRPTDVDPVAERRAERQVATLFGLSAVCTVLFVVCYFAFHIGSDPSTLSNFGLSTLTLGLTLGGALLGIGFGIIQWARKLMGDHEIVELRHPARSSDEDREATLKALNEGLDESGIGRRPLVRNSLLGAVGLVAIPPIIALRDLGPTPQQTENAAEGTGLNHTVWGMTPDMRVVRDVVGSPIRPGDLDIGDLVNGVPAVLFETDPSTNEPVIDGTALQVAKAKAAVIMVKMEPEEIIPASPDRDNWSVQGVICYSKICTHVGCPISLYERTTHHVLCPCHQSTFDLADGAKVIFGPAARPLPQLPLKLDSEGYLCAQHDFYEPVGPSFWERG